MKKNFSLLLTSLFVAGCGCSSEDAAGHATGLPGGPTDSSYGTYEVEKLVYNYVKNEADFLAGYITADEYCEHRDEVYPNESINKGACKESNFTKYYEGIMKDQSALEDEINKVIEHVRDNTGASYVIENIDTYIDYSGLKLNPIVDPTDSTLAKVSTGGYNITSGFTFNHDVSLQEFELTKALRGFYATEYTVSTDLTTPKVAIAERDVVLNDWHYVLEKNDDKWEITDWKWAE